MFWSYDHLQAEIYTYDLVHATGCKQPTLKKKCTLKTSIPGAMQNKLANIWFPLQDNTPTHVISGQDVPCQAQ
jgi:hypothetical protein